MGIVKLTVESQTLGGNLIVSLSLGARHLLPPADGRGTQDPTANGLCQMPSEPEQISDHGVYREKALGLAWRFEAARLSLPLP
jgi:hypothetical protein